MGDNGARIDFSGQAHYAVLAHTIYGGVHTHLPPGATPKQRAADQLAELVGAQWRDEANLRGLTGQVPLAVRWDADWSTADQRDNVGTSLSARGDGLARLAGDFLSSPHRRLVVLGPPGSGKSSLVILLTLELLAARGPDDPVPVILLLSTWNPDKEHVRDWLTRRISEDYAGRGCADLDSEAVRALVRDRRVLPVLEGFDELPDTRRDDVLARINEGLGPQHPVVLTSRRDEYAAATEDRQVLAAAAVIAARPVSAPAAVAHLRAAAHPRRLAAWQPLFDALTAGDGDGDGDGDDDGGGAPVATALSSPLMLWLATKVYAAPDADPGELTRIERFPTAADIETHLLDGLVPAVFTDTPPSPDQIQPARRWPADRAARSLRFLAVHMDRLHTRDLAWWELRAFPVHPAVWAVPLGIALYFAWIFAYASAYDALAHVWGSDAFGSHDSFDTADGIASGLVYGPLSGLAVACILLVQGGKPRQVRVAAREVAATVLLLLLSATALRYLGTLGTFLVSVSLPSFLVLLLTRPARTEVATRPESLLAQERTAALASLAIATPVIGCCSAWAERETDPGWEVGAGRGLLAALAAALIIGLTSRWSRWRGTELLLAARRRLPRHILAFLRDAHRLGVLRQVGGVYQFRHVSLQQRLADRRPVREVPSEVWVRMVDPSPYLKRLFGILGGGGALFSLMLYVGYEFSAASPGLVFILLLAYLEIFKWRVASRALAYRITGVGIDCVHRSLRQSIPWDDVLEVTVRESSDGDFVIQFRVRSEPEDEEIIMRLLGKYAAVPSHIDDALTRYAGDRWNPFP